MSFLTWLTRPRPTWTDAQVDGLLAASSANLVRAERAEGALEMLVHAVNHLDVAVPAPSRPAPHITDPAVAEAMRLATQVLKGTRTREVRA